MSASVTEPFSKVLRWLSAQTNFPAYRLPDSAERLLLIAVANEADEIEIEAAKTPIQRRDTAKDSAMRAHAMRRSLVHYRCDNGAKV